MTEERKKTGRQELRRKLRELEQERDLLVERLESTNKELKLHALWCDSGERKPSRSRAWFNALWTWVTELAGDRL